MWSDTFDDCDGAPKKKRRIDKNARKVENRVQESTAEPMSITDLVTHSRKIEEVRSWLQLVDHSAEILLITGPAGSAKTITFKTVAQASGFSIQEWVNPVEKLEYDISPWLEQTHDPSSYKEPKQIEKFESFIFQSSRYRILTETNSKRVLLIEDFPNFFIRNSSNFHRFLLKYKSFGHCPMVFICTDDDKLNLSYELFPNDLRSTLRVANIKFNPIPHTALMRVLKKHGSALTKNSLEKIAATSNGDIRAALTQLRFIQIGTPSNNNDSSVLTKDVTIDFYQVLGRVLYPKRRDSPSEDGRLFVHNVLLIAEDYNEVFLSMLHENFLETFSNIKDVIEGCCALSDTDVFVRYGDDLKSYAGLACTIGLMCANKNCKKGKFRAMGKSKWLGLEKENKDRSVRKYPEFACTNRTLNLDFLPYLKMMPSYASKLSMSDVDRLRSASSCSHRPMTNLFKVPLPVHDATDMTDEEEMVIEEFDD